MKIGLTMRHSRAREYQEDRDAIARDWPLFLQQYLPHIQWMLLPNLSANDMVKYVARWELEGFLVTGGDDPGMDSMRDQAERALLDYAVSHRKPVLGICRGFQVIQQYLDGALTPCATDEHLSRSHTVHFSPQMRFLFPDKMDMRVNSYHRMGIKTKDLAPPLMTLAMTGEWVECAVSEKPALMGMLWHPERAGGDPLLDGNLMERFFQGKINLPET